MMARYDARCAGCWHWSQEIMAANTDDPVSLTSSGFDALRRGDARTANAFFRRATASGAGADAWFGLSVTHRSLGSHDDEQAALDRTLELDPRHIPALIRKGDLHTARDDARAATSFYRAAIKLAGSMGNLPPQWGPEIARIKALCEQNARAFEHHLLADLTRAGFEDRGAPRFAHALELLLGRRQIYLQQPKYFFFPELPQIQFYDRSAFPWAGELEQDTAAIREELLAVLRSGKGLVPYMQSEADRPSFDNNGLLDDPAWSAFHLIRNGVEVESSAALCPATLRALRRLPVCRIAGRTPTALFSVLRPGAHIPPHHGFMNVRLICHLPLIVPPDCMLRVGNETRPWREGELVIFDDTIEHEAWNRSAQLRAVLLFDIWRPEVTAAERSLVAATLESIDRFGGPRREWSQ
jgi:aspartate beta-hydroxylase